MLHYKGSQCLKLLNDNFDIMSTDEKYYSDIKNSLKQYFKHTHNHVKRIHFFQCF